MKKFIAFAASSACLVLAVNCGPGAQFYSGAGGAGGSSASFGSSGSSGPESGSGAGSDGGACYWECGTGFTSRCGVVADSCGETTCACPAPMDCLHEDRCCQKPSFWNYQAEADAKCAAYPGYGEAYFCGETPGWDPDALDAGIEKPWLDVDGIPIAPLPGPIPGYCKRAPYWGQTGFVLWCCQP